MVATRRRAGQLPLDTGAGPARKGVVERAAELDLKVLRQEETIPDGMKALEATYRLLARELDRAEVERDRYGKLNAARELRATRERLGVIQPVTGSDADAFWDELSPEARDTTEP